MRSQVTLSITIVPRSRVTSSRTVQTHIARRSSVISVHLPLDVNLHVKRSRQFRDRRGRYKSQLHPPALAQSPTQRTYR